jgi:hypothetical protein
MAAMIGRSGPACEQPLTDLEKDGLQRVTGELPKIVVGSVLCSHLRANSRCSILFRLREFAGDVQQPRKDPSVLLDSRAHEVTSSLSDVLWPAKT